MRYFLVLGLFKIFWLYEELKIILIGDKAFHFQGLQDLLSIFGSAIYRDNILTAQIL